MHGAKGLLSLSWTRSSTREGEVSRSSYLKAQASAAVAVTINRPCPRDGRGTARKRSNKLAPRCTVSGSSRRSLMIHSRQRRRMSANLGSRSSRGRTAPASSFARRSSRTHAPYGSSLSCLGGGGGGNGTDRFLRLAAGSPSMSAKSERDRERVRAAGASSWEPKCGAGAVADGMMKSTVRTASDRPRASECAVAAALCYQWMHPVQRCHGGAALPPCFRSPYLVGTFMSMDYMERDSSTYAGDRQDHFPALRGLAMIFDMAHDTYPGGPTQLRDCTHTRASGIASDTRIRPSCGPPRPARRGPDRHPPTAFNSTSTETHPDSLYRSQGFR